MSAAFLLDVAFLTYDAEANGYTADADRIAEIEAELHIDVWADATQVHFYSLEPILQYGRCTVFWTHHNRLFAVGHAFTVCRLCRGWQAEHLQAKPPFR